MVVGRVGNDMNRLITFRVDASIHIGTGHVMRCITLADALSKKGADCQFICKLHEGHLIDFIRSKGYVVHALSLTKQTSDAFADQLAHSRWLGTSQQQDASGCLSILLAQKPSWLVVDHYALDVCWEQQLRPYCGKLMVIDDLADRRHFCDILLDQTYDRDANDYTALVPADCQLLCGTQYALLRPEFAALRPYSMQRRVQAQLRRLLITMGGVDKDNVTSQVLIALRASPLPFDCQITVVMGTTAPWLAQVQQLAKDMPWSTHVLIGVNDMAQLMADSDLAIGAAGATSWERCCLGLPTIILVLASNQQHVAQALKQADAARIIPRTQDIASYLPRLLKVMLQQPEVLKTLSQSAARIVDGQGIANLIYILEN